MRLTYVCPSCGTRLARIDTGDVATEVVTRTCKRCGDRWQIVTTPLRVSEQARIDRGTFAFLDNRFTRRTSGDHR